MKTKFILGLSILLILLLPACTGTQATPVYMAEGSDRDAITADSDIFVQHILKGIENKDYATFAQDFDTAMVSAMKEADFNTLTALYSPLGAATSIEMQNVQAVDKYYSVNYKVTYPEKTITVRVVVDQNTPRKVSGLWLK